MSPKLPINNAQTISDFLNLNKAEISEKTSEDSSKFAFDDPAFWRDAKPWGSDLNWSY